MLTWNLYQGEDRDRQAKSSVAWIQMEEHRLGLQIPASIDIEAPTYQPKYQVITMKTAQ